MTPAQDLLDRLVALALDGVRRPALVLHEPGLAPDPAAAPDDEAEGPVETLPWDAALPESPPRTVVVVASDLGSLRHCVSLLSGLRWAREVGVVLLHADRPVPVRPGPLCPPVTAGSAQLVDGGAVTTLELASRTSVHELLAALARAAAPGPTGHRGLRVAGADPAWSPPADVTVSAAWDPDAERPADVVLAVGAGEPLAVGEVSAVTGRAAVVVDPGLGALDAAVWHPARLGHRPETSDGPDGQDRPGCDLPADARLTTALVADLAGAPSVRVRWHGDPADPVDRAWLRTVAGLALCGVPLVAPDPAPAQVRRLLGDALTDALAPEHGPAETSTSSTRARRSARLRRAALETHSAPAWRRRVGDLVGVRTVEHPRVADVALDPDDVHGPGLEALVQLAATSDADLLLLHAAGSAPAELDLALHDLLRAREHSGADVVGVGVDTVSAGGPVLLDRARLREVDAEGLDGSDPADRRSLVAWALDALRRHGATTYAASRAAADLSEPAPAPARLALPVGSARGPGPTTQPRVRRNEWQGIAVPGLGAWEPTLPVSVVVPAYTAGRLLPTVLAGLVAQTYPAHLLEVIVVDDGPVPGELVLPELRPERTRLVRADTAGAVASGHWGRAHACHLGALAADGDVIHWLDADMLLERDQVEAQLRWHHQLDHVVTLGTKWFVDPAPALARTPQQVHDGVVSGEMPSWWDGLERTPHTWVEEIFERTDDLRAMGWNALRCHTGAVAAVGRELYLASGGMDPTLRLGEDIALGGRLAEVGAVFVPDREARSLHLGPTQVMSRQVVVNDYNDPFLADRVPMLHAHRRHGRTYTGPYLEVVLDARDHAWADVVATVDAVLASTLTDLEVTLVGDWEVLTEGRHPVLDQSVDVRIVHQTYAAEPRVRLVAEPPRSEGPRPAPWRLTLPGTAWGPGRAALERVLLHLEHTHDGLRLLRLPDGSVVRVERTAAVARAARTRRPEESLDAVLAQVAGAAELVAGPEGRVRFLPSVQVRPARYARTGGPPVDDTEAWRRVDKALHQRR